MIYNKIPAGILAKPWFRLQAVTFSSRLLNKEAVKSVCLCSLLHFRYYRIGVLVLFLHDVNDVILEFTKLCVAFKSRGRKYHVIPDVLSIVGFLSFASLW